MGPSIINKTPILEGMFARILQLAPAPQQMANRQKCPKFATGMGTGNNDSTPVLKWDLENVIETYPGADG